MNNAHNRTTPAQGIAKGFSSVWENREHLQRLLPAIAAAGFSGIEPTFTPRAIPSPTAYRREAPLLAGMCREVGLQIPSMRSGGLYWLTVALPRRAEREEALECLALLGGTTLLVVPGELSPGTSYREHWKRVLEFAARAGELAADLDAILAMAELPPAEGPGESRGPVTRAPATAADSQPVDTAGTADSAGKPS